MYRLILISLIVVLCFSACASTIIIPDDLSPAEIIQRAQEASDRNRYKQALQYYEALHERNPYNNDLVCTAEYEISFIYYKQKKYAQAKEGFNALLERYDAPGGEQLPQQFKLLAQKVLERIEEKENSPLSFFSRIGEKKEQ